MGKSNKFDFTHRPSSGIKLGNSIASALIKDAEKLQKDADKAAQKARKQSSSSTMTTGSEAKDPYAHRIDLQAPGKDLGDSGVMALAAGLEEALRSGTETAALSLEVLNLSGNGITTASLGCLAPIIELSGHDLQVLNLAGNNIEIRDSKTSLEWEKFLRSFSSSSHLTRLDLSQNKLGSRALEVLARVYLGECAVIPIPVDEEERSSQELLDDNDDNSLMTLRRPLQFGLRSVPYITLHCIGMEDAGALWLSYILEEHYYPKQLHHEALETTGGLSWAKNVETLTKDGLHLLQKTEQKRTNLIAAVDSVDTEAETPVASTFSSSNRTRSGSRAVPNDANELDHARMRIQRQMIEHAVAVELWRAALKLINASRMVLFISPTSKSRCLVGSGPTVPKTPKKQREPSHLAQVTRSAPRHGKKMSIDIGRARSGSYAARLQTTNAPIGEPELAITEVTNSPVTPKLTFKPHRKGGFSDGVDVTPIIHEKLEGLIIRDDSPDRFANHLEKHFRAGNFRDSSRASHLTASLLERIVEAVLDGDDLAILSEKQRRNAIEWGQSRAAMQVAADWRKKDESSQIWMLLEAVGCLAYGQ
ncbi:leucine Rich Repeat protein [Teratosphaeria destructans]|uniref:Leucine Rich Repeat protein n=1 Tax=Teratosphaeria destructans TaxID=418781 RepID=A0A9W7SJ23_9PEZI|nr:leucine Rich Repeat protein [Teratosphaeria destructans]